MSRIHEIEVRPRTGVILVRHNGRTAADVLIDLARQVSVEQWDQLVEAVSAVERGEPLDTDDGRTIDPYIVLESALADINAGVEVEYSDHDAAYLSDMIHGVFARRLNRVTWSSRERRVS